MKPAFLLAAFICLLHSSVFSQAVNVEPVSTACDLSEIHKHLSGAWNINYKGVNGTVDINVGSDGTGFQGPFSYPDKKGGQIRGNVVATIRTGKDKQGNCSYLLTISWTEGDLTKQGELLLVKGSKVMSGTIGSTTINASRK